MPFAPSEKGQRLCRFGLLILCAVCIVSGLVVVGVSIYMYVDKSDLLTYAYLMNVARPACILVLASAATLVAVGLFGVIAAILRSRILLIIFVALSILVAATAIVGALLAISGRAQWTDYIRNNMVNMIQTQYGVNVSTIPANAFTTAMWDRAQEVWYCCGTDDRSWGVYRSSVWYDQQYGSKEFDRPLVPVSCCTKNQYGQLVNVQKCQLGEAGGPPRTQSSIQPNEALFYKGCYTVGSALLQRCMSGLIAMGIILCIIICVSVGLAIILILALCNVDKRDPPIIRQAAYSVNKNSASIQKKPPPLNGNY